MKINEVPISKKDEILRLDFVPVEVNKKTQQGSEFGMQVQDL